MIAKIMSGGVVGIEGFLIEVEVHLAAGLPGMAIVGLPDTAIKESSNRVEAAIKNTNLDLPIKKITVNLAPADIRKEGSAFDLPIAIGILKANDVLRDNPLLIDHMILGELSLDGRIRPIKGALPIATKARETGLKGMLLPKQNAEEASIVDGINIYPIEDLPQALAFLNQEIDIPSLSPPVFEVDEPKNDFDVDFVDVKGQHHVKRAIEIAASGGHNILLIGPPGSGKSMLAKRIPTILPPMSLNESIESTKIHSVSGLITDRSGLLKTRPFRSPHHTISDAGLIGGGRVPIPGEVSLAHNGVLFLDEFPEFKRHVLEVLRQPLEDGKVVISRATASLTYPTHFMLVAAMNPCPCGFRSDPKRNCECTPPQIQRYISKISGPLLDRIDIHIEVPTLDYKELSDEKLSENSLDIRKRVEKARKVQWGRFKNSSAHSNAQMNHSQIKANCHLDEDSKAILGMAIDKMGLSARAHDRILKVARTIADLGDSASILPEHVAEAIQYRSLDRSSWVTG